MKKLLIGVILPTLLIISCKSKQEEKNSQQKESAINTLTTAETNEGWILLFDGKTFNGWRSLGRDMVQKEHWKIEDGAIRKLNSGEVPSLADGQPMEGGDLMTEDSFDNFELYFEWKISNQGNTGLKYNVSEEMSQKYDSKYSALGFEYQLLDDKDSTYAGKLKPSQYTGGLYDLVIPKNTRIKPVGEYNSSKISINGNHVEHWLNGDLVLTYELGSPHLDSLFQASKYRDIPQFLEKRKGHIVLQNHKDDAWFRNIKIRKTPAKE
ncbi:hypothetical protein KCTC52924_00160 [Arenibacter antarcticus]|uniref:DUF1080 domain-containing protein n=1 Tax=Arenibacter antarcticus TaxID=2040469 RepID=A0ABW5VN69_9FLAO|nr:DUF1080 domain-containing protein [Arenibacter sp. H213]